MPQQICRNSGGVLWMHTCWWLWYVFSYSSCLLESIVKKKLSVSTKSKQFSSFKFAVLSWPLYRTRNLGCTRIKPTIKLTSELFFTPGRIEREDGNKRYPRGIKTPVLSKWVMRQAKRVNSENTMDTRSLLHSNLIGWQKKVNASVLLLITNFIIALSK